MLNSLLILPSPPQLEISGTSDASDTSYTFSASCSLLATSAFGLHLFPLPAWLKNRRLFQLFEGGGMFLFVLGLNMVPLFGSQTTLPTYPILEQTFAVNNKSAISLPFYPFSHPPFQLITLFLLTLLLYFFCPYSFLFRYAERISSNLAYSLFSDLCSLPSNFKILKVNINIIYYIPLTFNYSRDKLKGINIRV
jgi:hypothetical protein